jgi:hypothetical protein
MSTLFATDCVVLGCIGEVTRWFPLFPPVKVWFESHLGHICSKNDLLDELGPESWTR